MIGTITYILACAGWRAMNGQIADERRRLAGAEPPAAYVSYDPRLLAGVGWYGYRIAFKGGDRQMIERARYMLSDRYTIRDSYEYYADGVYVIGVLLRQRVPHYGIGGGVEPTPEPDALNFYMPNGGTVSLNKTGSPTVVELEYSIDRGTTWSVWQPDNNGNRSLVLSAGQRMYVRNTSETQTGFSTSANNFYRFTFTNTVEAHGNTNSLLCKNAESITTLSSFCYYNLFASANTLVTAPKLPATVLAESCYRVMFDNCSSIVVAPELPATTLASECYRAMFYSCQSLVTAPELPATNLATFCYMYMFENCTSLVVAPELPATVLTESCYRSLFYNCTSLQEIRTQMTDISAANSLTNWLYGVAAQGDFYCPAELTIPTGASGIPSGWTRHNYENELYLNFYMPNGGTISLNKTGSPTVVELEYSLDGGQTWTVWQPDNDGNRSLVLSAGQRMYVRNTSETQTGFSTTGDDCYQFSFTDSVEAHGNINSLLCKNSESVTSLSASCYRNLFRSCTSLITAPELPATTLNTACYLFMFYKCNSLVSVPELPATALSAYCYSYMFGSCALLKKIRTRMTDISADGCLNGWLEGVAATGDFYCPAELTISTGNSGIPSGWTRHDL